MQTSKLINTIKLIPKNQLNDFSEFLNSPFFNKSEKTIQLFQHIQNYAPEYASTKLNKEFVFSVIFLKEEYNENKLALLMNHLLEQVENYIVYKTFSEDQEQRFFYLLKAYNEGNLEKNYNSTLRQYKKHLDESGQYKSEIQKSLFELSLLELEHNARKNIREFDNSLQIVSDDLDRYFVSQKLRLGCEMLSRKKIIQSGYEINLLEEVIEYINNSDFKAHPEIEVYGLIAKMLSDEDNELNYTCCKQRLIKEKKSFSKNELRSMVFYAFNYCIRKFNKGKIEYVKELFEWNKFLITENLLLVDGELSPWRFKNITIIGLKSKEYDWTAKFIDDMESYVSLSHREAVSTYCKAYLSYSIKDYDKAMDLLREVLTDDIFMEIDYRVLLIKIYYEKNELEALYNLLDSFRVYLGRNKVLSDYHKKVKLNWIKIVKKLMRILPGETKKLEELKTSIKETKEIDSKDWLFEMIDAKK
ncbi:MAG: hypothetical protein HKN92_08385 [Chitinophagales bacterium]|nr:hypothetical protein [Chitinophagales bacterium]